MCFIGVGFGVVFFVFFVLVCFLVLFVFGDFGFDYMFDVIVCDFFGGDGYGSIGWDFDVVEFFEYVIQGDVVVGEFQYQLW